MNKKNIPTRFLKTELNFAELIDQSKLMKSILDHISLYVKNEILILKNELLGKSDANEELQVYRENIKNDMNAFNPELYPQILDLAMLKSQVEFLSTQILANFNIFQSKSYTNDRRLKASEENNLLNEQHKTLDKQYMTNLQQLLPIFTKTEHKIYNQIFKSLVDNTPLNIIIDVVNHYEEFLNGNKTEHECFNHGINYTENMYSNIPKGLLKRAFKKK
jgi:hypothetical protein